MNINGVYPPIKVKVFFQGNQYTALHYNAPKWWTLMHCLIKWLNIQAQKLMLNVCLTEKYQAASGFSRAYSCRLWRMFTPSLKNVASSVHTT
jgi:hypothetical protein